MTTTQINYENVEREQEILKTVMDRNKIKPTGNIEFNKFVTNYFQQGNFMICTITINGEVITAGVAKRNPVDKFLIIVGLNKSFVNALKNLFCAGSRGREHSALRGRNLRPSRTLNREPMQRYAQAL